jgi:hypothetical protein
MTVPAESIIRAEDENTVCKVLKVIVISQSPDEIYSTYVYYGMDKQEDGRHNNCLERSGVS